MAFDAGPPRDCPDCPRLAAFRADEPGGFPTGRTRRCLLRRADARVADRRAGAGFARRQPDGRPLPATTPAICSTATLVEFGFASGAYDRRPDDGLTLVDCAIVNAVRCVPPQNKPSPRKSQPAAAISPASWRAALKMCVALGRIAHDSALRTFGLRLAKFPFAHGALHPVEAGVRASSTATIARATTPTHAC